MDLRLVNSRITRFKQMVAVFFWALQMLRLVFVIAGAMFLMQFFYVECAVAKVNIPKNGRYLVNRHLINDSGVSRVYRHIVQDGRGLVYAGGQLGIFQYDGVRWRLVSGSRFINVSFMAVDQNDRVFVGGVKHFGYINHDQSGRPYYQSISKHLVEDEKVSEFILHIHIEQDKVIFVGDRAIYIWGQAGGDSIIEAEDDHFTYSFSIEGQLLIQTRSGGLYKIQQGKLKPYLTGELKGKHVVMMERFNKGFLLATSYDGLFFYDGRQIKPFPTEADQLIKKFGLFYGKLLNDGRIALGTSKREGGLVLLDQQGVLLNFVTADNGLWDGRVGWIEQDTEGDLWLALISGVAHIELSSASFFDYYHGIDGQIYSMRVVNNDIYVVTTDGVLKLVYDQMTGKTLFDYISPKVNCYNIVPTVTGLVMGCQGTINLLDSESDWEVIYQSDHQRFNWIVPVDQPVSQILVGNTRGLGLLTLKKDKWIYRDLFPELINMNIYNILKENEKSYWFQNRVNGAVNIYFPQGFSKPPIIHYYDETNGLPAGYIEITIVNGQPIFSSEQGVFVYDRLEKNTRSLFKRSSLVPEVFKGQYVVVGQESNGSVWMIVYKDISRPPSMNNRFRIFLADSGDNANGYEWRELLLSIPDLVQNAWVELSLDNYIWLSSGDRLYPVDSSKKRFSEKTVKPLLRQIQNAKGGEILYGGSKDIKTLALAYEDGSLIFDYAYPYYSVKERNSYQYQLQGYSDQWSEWSSDTRKEYTDLREGRYQFKIRARNVYGDIAESDAFAFEINAPWYRTWYAYLAYIVLFLAFFYLVIKLYTQTLRNRASYLESVVKQRTARIESLLKAKNTLFSNVSHEFRTPLTLIQGPITELMEQNKNPKQKSLLKMVQRNTQRLLNMVEQLLSVARIESPNEQEQKLYEWSNIIRLQLDSLQVLIKEKQLTCHIELAESVCLSAIPDALETISLNLLTNAIKYTPSGGTVWISLTCDHGQAYLSVKDNGLGIAEQNHESIFKRFVRIDNDGNRQIQGTGLGLAMVKELVELHQGSIRVKSALGQGAEFVLSLPIADQHQAATVEKAVSQPSQVNAPASLVSSAEQGQHENNREKTGNSKPQLLIIEDTADMRDYLYSILQAKYDCLLASDGEAGLRLAKAHLPDLIISDVMMLGLDGFQVLQAIREAPLTSHIPLILLTAKGDEESRLKGINQLADDYIAKPFEKNLLLARIKNLLAVRALLRNALAQQFQQDEYPQAQYQKVLGEQKQCFIKQFHQLIEGHYHDADYSVKKMAGSLNVSVRQLQKKLKSELDKGPKEYLVAFRLKLAAKYLRESELSVSEISATVGFSSPSHFANTFKAHYAISASEYRHQAVIS